ncbi:MAG: lytic transglycosylase domain-containing protein [Desulfobacteraceae bacterium]|nr:MAG: lytic transglycosylase domain-containing protein [Desulfobacteraceae bacterium]
MIKHSFRIISLSGILFFCIGLAESRADIYRYKDEEGVWHFSNIKSDRRYKLYIQNSKTSSRTVTRYIQDFDGIIKQASERFGIEASLIKAVIKAESDFNHRAVSCKGAQGLMQLMPDTADTWNVEDPFDPASNIFGGTRYLRHLLERFNLDLGMALAAYNAGPEKVIEYRGIPPFSETMNFVKKVITYYQQYLTEAKL